MRLLFARAAGRRLSWEPLAVSLRSPAKAPVFDALHRTKRFAACQNAVGSAEVRDRFLSLLRDKQGDTNDVAIVEELKLLQKANPTPDPALTGDYLDGDWLQISKSDRLAFNARYPLGRLASNMYEPADMVFRIDRAVQPVRPLPGCNNSSREYEVLVEMTCRASDNSSREYETTDDRYPEFKVVMRNFARINPAKDRVGNNVRLTVFFTEGSMGPSPEMSEAMHEEWRNTFSPRQRNMFVRGLMRTAVGFETTPMDDDGAISYQLRRSPKGWLDVLYLDDLVRVTRGNFGSVVVCRRA